MTWLRKVPYRLCLNQQVVPNFVHSVLFSHSKGFQISQWFQQALSEPFWTPTQLPVLKWVVWWAKARLSSLELTVWDKDLCWQECANTSWWWHILSAVCRHFSRTVSCSLLGGLLRNGYFNLLMSFFSLSIQNDRTFSNIFCGYVLWSLFTLNERINH